MTAFTPERVIADGREFLYDRRGWCALRRSRFRDRLVLAGFLFLIISAGVTPAEPSAEWPTTHASPEWQARTKLAQDLDVGESAPDWLVDSESYAFGYGPNDWDALAESKVAFITHCPVNREFFARCHALGVRCFPYVTFYQGFASMTYEDVNLKDHPDFIEIDTEGNLKRTGFWESEDAKNMYTTCPNVQAYQDAMVAWVKKIMELGADGVFVDNLSSRAECFGPKFGKHQHIYDDQNHAFAMLLERVREVVKQVQPEGAVLGNSANPPSLPKEFWKYLDAEMLESYICTWVSKDRWFDWNDHWNKAGKDLQPFVRAGKQIQALSYLGHTPYGVREDGFFCYASARLAGFVWNGGPLSSVDLADLYRIRLGKPLTDECEENGVHYRVFERGFVAVNPDKEKAAPITIGAPMPTARLFDIFGGGAEAWNKCPEKGFALDNVIVHGGQRSIGCVNETSSDYSGAMQSVSLGQTAPKPIVITGWSKAENVSGDSGGAGAAGLSDGNYALYADVLYTDGTNLFGQIAPFDVGTHDWQSRTVTIRPEKPIASLTLNVLFRYKTGKVWFDDISLREENGGELLKNGGFEEMGRRGQIIEAGKTGQLEIPKYAGRVYLFAPESKDDLSGGASAAGLAVTGPKLTVVTSPPLGEVRFRVDGFDYWTYSGSWTTEYVLGPNFGKFYITFTAPGKHTLEIADIVPADMKTARGYGSGERLGQFMDPSNPTQPSEGKKFKFRGWEGMGNTASIAVDIEQDITVTAEFDVEQPSK